jgi:hypothetical protein
VNVSQVLDEVKAFLEGDPLVQAAVATALPATIRQALADLTRSLETGVANETAAAAEQARADAAAAYQQPAEPQ